MGLRLTEPHWALTGWLPDAALGLLDGKTPASWLCWVTLVVAQRAGGAILISDSFSIY